ncbi:MAG: hypothetical protein ACXVGC_10180 [Mycobacteriaceae bacterium]
MSDRVPNDRLREAIIDTGLSMSEVARNAELLKPDTGRVRVLLGLSPTHTTSRGRKYRVHCQNVNYDMAVRLCRAAGLDPVDVGL